MADKTLDPDTAALSAREILEQSVEKRVAAVRTLVAATNDVDAADRAAKDARDAHVKAWEAALATGWSDKELRATGVRPPVLATTRAYTRRMPKRSTEPVTEQTSVQETEAHE